MINGLGIFYMKVNKGSELKIVENKGDGLKLVKGRRRNIKSSKRNQIGKGLKVSK